MQHIKIPIALAILLMCLQACTNEDNLTPSYADEDRIAKYADTSKPLVKRLLDDFGTGLLYEYDANMDFRYTAGQFNTTQYFDAVVMPEIKDRFINADGSVADTVEYSFNLNGVEHTLHTYDEHVDAGLTFLDTTLFTYFKPGGLLHECFPPKVLLCSSIYVDGTGNKSEFIKESDSRIIVPSSGSFVRLFYNQNSIIFSSDFQNLSFSTSAWESWKKDNLFIFLMKIIEENNLDDAIPRELFADMVPYYTTNIGTYFNAWPATSRFASIDTDEYLKTGFLDSRFVKMYHGQMDPEDDGYYYTPSEDDEKTTATEFGQSRRIYAYQNFYSKEANIRSYINELIYRPKAENNTHWRTTALEDLPDNVKTKMRGMIEVLTEWGFDIKRVNPDLEVLYEK
ncbi:MAG: hypothetical protein MI866_00130 [Bacteroidales bacterium]|nr:hypothetical protein [Bacteroidales bacterium]